MDSTNEIKDNEEVDTNNEEQNNNNVNGKKTKKAKQEKLRKFEIVQQEEFLSKEKIEEALNKTDEYGKNHLIKYAYILHNKDTKLDKNNNVVNIKPHWHIIILMDNAYLYQYVADRFGVKENCVNKIKKDLGSALKYLTHNTKQAKEENKFLYDEDEVISNFDVQKEIASMENQFSINSIIAQIGDGTIRRFNYTQYISIEQYTKYKRQIETAFDYREDKIKEINRNMEVIYIQGESGSGKTTYAKKYAEKNNFSVYISSGSNDVLGDYKGEDCLILDDLRPSVMGMSDLLKLTDNHTSSTIKSRYRNKSIQECQLLIITSILNMKEFFNKVFTEEEEPIKQLQRRCKTNIRMTKDRIYISFYDEIKDSYTEEIVMENKICSEYEKMTYNNKDEILNQAKRFIVNGNKIL